MTVGTPKGGALRHATLCLIPLLAAGCFVESADPTGKRCDDSHPCPDGLNCVAGTCIAGCGSQAGQPCTAGKGECARTGTYQCASGRLSCDAQPGTASAEICDGKDNDCDGDTDNGLTAPSCALTAGACAGAVKRCGGAAGWLDCTAADYGADYELAETKCDGKDNDCDGTTDHISAAPACPLTVGVCAGAVERCDGSNGWLDCTAADYGADYEAVETKCDGKDNDCDGTTDNIPGAPACPLTAGVCAGAVKRCDGSGGWLACTAADYGADYEAVETRCDGKDNDCDGHTDNGLTAPACALTKGVCAGSVKRCGGSGGWLDCTAADYGTAFEAKEQSCDGKDNDCNGYVDDVSGCVWTVTGVAPPGYADGDAMTAARFFSPRRLLALSNGDLLISEDGANTIRRVNLTTHAVTTVAGIPFVTGWADGALGTGTMDGPRGMIERADGTVLIADCWNSQIRSLKNGLLSTVAGTGAWGWANGNALTQASFSCPTDMVEVAGRVYIADSYNCLLRVWDGTNVTTATGGAGCGYTDDVAANAQFYTIYGLAADASGNVFMSEEHGRIRVLWATGPNSGKVTTLAGASWEGFADGNGTSARFDNAQQLAATPTGLYVADQGNDRIRFVTWAGDVTTVAGTGWEDLRDGLVGEAHFDTPGGLVVVGGVVYTVGDGEARLRKIDSGIVTTIAGGPLVPWADGPRGAARLYRPLGATSDPATGMGYFTDAANYVVRSFTPDGTVTTVAGIVGDDGYHDADLTHARFGWLNNLRVRPDGALLVADTGNSVIRLVDLTGNSVTTFAGTGDCDQADGPIATTPLCRPTDFVLAPTGALYVANEGRFISKIAGGQVTTLNGTLWYWGCGDDPGGTGSAHFADPEGIALGPDGLLYVGDQGCCTIRTVDPSTGAVATILGNPGDCSHTDDGPAAGASLDGPSNLMFIGNDLYFLETSTAVVRKYSQGTLTTVAGTDDWGFSDGLRESARFFRPWGLGPAPGGGFYLADTGNNRIRRVQP